jgi:hypothetical protein
MTPGIKILVLARPTVDKLAGVVKNKRAVRSGESFQQVCRTLRPRRRSTGDKKKYAD